MITIKIGVSSMVRSPRADLIEMDIWAGSSSGAILDGSGRREAALSFEETLRQLGDIRRDPPRLIAVKRSPRSLVYSAGY
jgi:hypothetical protein